MRQQLLALAPTCVVGICSVACVVGLAACGGRGSQGFAGQPNGTSLKSEAPASAFQPMVQPPIGQLPSLDELLRVKASSTAQDDCFRAGSDYTPSLRNTQVTLTGTALLFSPQTIKPQPQVSDIAVAIYEFQAGGLSGAQSLTLNWSAKPLNFAEVFVGISDFGQGRWVFSPIADAPLALGNLATKQAADGRFFVAIAMLGGGTAELAWLRLGPNLTPVAVLACNPSSGPAPFTAPLDASASSDVDGSIASFAYDLDNNGSFELLDQAANLPHQFTSSGAFTCTVRVTDDGGASSTASIVVNVTGGGGAPSAGLVADYVFGDAPYIAGLDASSSLTPNGLDRFDWDLDGNGTFETPSGVDPTVSFNVAGGAHDASVRVTDSLGLTATASVTCLGDSDGYDEVEHNDTFDAGNQIDALGIQGFEGNLGDTGSYDGDLEDWFKVVISAPQAVQFNMYFLDADADLDMRLLDTDGTTQLGASSSVDDDEQITYSFTTPGTYFVRCFRYGTTSSFADYTLEFKRLNAPSVSLGADITSGNAPLLVTFTASASDSDGTVSNIDWDYNGDGTFEFDSGTTATTAHLYTSGGMRDAAVRVTDNDGATAEAQLAITTIVNYAEVEDNDSAPAGQVLPVLPFSNFIGNIGTGGGNDGDESDWYKFDAAAGQELCFILAFASSECDIDFALVDSDANTVLISSLGTDDDEYVTFVAPAADTFYLNVQIKASAGIRGPADYLISGYDFVLDEVEPNETFDVGNALPTFPFASFGGEMGVHIGTEDPADWYKVDVTAAGSHTLWMRFIDDACDIDMKLFDSDGTTQLATSTNTDNDERIVFNYPAAGTYYLKVYNYALGPANYLLQGL